MGSKLASITLIIMAILLLWFVVSFTNNYAVDHRNMPLTIQDFAGTADCKTTKSGWSCQFNVSQEEMETTSLRDLQIVNAYKNECESTGGAWRCYGYCMPFYEHYCDYEYKDAGDFCFQSLQCGGKCIFQNGVAKCSKYPVRTCDRDTEIFLGIPILDSIICD